jgi:hypothetical protein
MSAPEKRARVVEVHWEHALTWGVFGILSLLAGLFFLKYGYDWLGVDFTSLSWPFFAMAPLLIAYAGYRIYASKHEESHRTSCPYCDHEIEFTAKPTEDFVCDKCHRRVPVLDGKILDVTGVRCGYCGALNYMSEKTEVLICEDCDREIPLLDAATGEVRHAPRGFARVDDEYLYALSLTGVGRDREAMIVSLQHMLALNRNQVKDLLEELPATLLTGINRRKAEMLKAQLEASGGDAEFIKVGEQAAR